MKIDYDAMSCVKQLPITFDKILVKNLTGKMKPDMANIWNDILTMDIDNGLESLCKAFQSKDPGFFEKSDIYMPSSNEPKANVIYHRINTNDYLKRRNRIVLFNLPNTDNTCDNEMFNSLASELNMHDISVKKMFRINSKSGKINGLPLNVEFCNFEDKCRFISKYNRLLIKSLPISSQFHGVSVAPDRSFEERKDYRKLRHIMDIHNNELRSKGILNKRWIIKDMQLTQIAV